MKVKEKASPVGGEREPSASGLWRIPARGPADALPQLYFGNEAGQSSGRGQLLGWPPETLRELVPNA